MNFVKMYVRIISCRKKKLTIERIIAMKKIKAVKALAAAIAGAVTVSLSGCYFLPDEEEIIDPPKVKTSEAGYTTIVATKKDIVDQVINSGVVSSVSSSEVAYEEQGGVIKTVYVQTGDTVKKGDLICECDTAELDFQIREKELYIRKAELQKQLLQEQGAMQSEIDMQQVEVDILNNEYETLKEQKELSMLYSPIDGTVSSLSDLQPGSEVAPGQPVATIVDPSDVYIEIQPVDYTVFKLNDSVNIRIDGEIYEGEVFMTPGDIPENMGDDDYEGLIYNKRDVYVRFKDAPPENCINIIADVILVLDERKDVVAVANNLIKEINGEKVVYLLKDGKKEAVTVELGLVTGSQSEIISGVEEGDEIVIR